MLNIDLSLLNALPYEVITSVYMFASAMENRVPSKSNCGLVINSDEYFLDRSLGDFT